MNAEKSLIDLTYLQEMTEGNKELMIEMIDIFKDQVPEFTEDMKKALAASDWKALASHAHKAKSSVAIIGITSLVEDLKNLETMAGQGINSESYKKMVENFISVCKQAIPALDKIISELKSKL